MYIYITSGGVSVFMLLHLVKSQPTHSRLHELSRSLARLQTHVYCGKTLVTCEFTLRKFSNAQQLSAIALKKIKHGFFVFCCFSAFLHEKETRNNSTIVLSAGWLYSNRITQSLSSIP